MLSNRVTHSLSENKKNKIYTRSHPSTTFLEHRGVHFRNLCDLAKYEADTTHANNMLCVVTSENNRSQRYDLHAPYGDKARHEAQFQIRKSYVGENDSQAER